MLENFNHLKNKTDLSFYHVPQSQPTCDPIVLCLRFWSLSDVKKDVTLIIEILCMVAFVQRSPSDVKAFMSHTSQESYKGGFKFEYIIYLYTFFNFKW